MVVDVKVDPETGEIDPADKEAVAVRHVRELEAGIG